MVKTETQVEQTLLSQRNAIKIWKGILAAFTLFFVIIFITLLPFAFKTKKPSYLNEENYRAITNDISYQDVVEILDNHQGELQSEGFTGMYTITYYQWSNKQGTKVIVVGFINNYVFTKSQSGIL